MDTKLLAHPTPNTHHPKEEQMLTETQQTRIARRCTEAVIKAVDAFPAYLASSEPEQAAAIVADLIKSEANRPTPVEPEESLEKILAEVARGDQQFAP
jgi:hypothetical protein